VDAEFPGVAEGFDLFGFECGVFELAVLDVARAGAALPVAAEFDAVRRVDVDSSCTLPRRPSRSLSEAITCKLSPRTIRFDQLASWR